MSDRFYAESIQNGSTVELSPAESHHLSHVLRKSVGEQVCLFDGKGYEATAEIEQITKKSVQLQILHRSDQFPKLQPEIVLATAVPKGDRFRWLVEKAAELGVSRLIPLKTRYSVVHPNAGKLEKMRQTVVAAAKQSGAHYLMDIAEVQSWVEFLQSKQANESALIAHPGAMSLARIIQEQSLLSSRQQTIVIGPEGGFSEEELRTAEECSMIPFGMGQHILRIETAGIVAAGFLRLYSR
ncbi:MAG: 16S rRNA (uracil(1498)-N(3))-methyltransferase [Planctomycetaceae bacterium]